MGGAETNTEPEPEPELKRSMFATRFHVVRAFIFLFIWMSWLSIPVRGDWFTFPRWGSVFLGPSIYTLQFAASFVLGAASVLVINSRAAFLAYVLALLPLLDASWLDPLNMTAVISLMLGCLAYFIWLISAPAYKGPSANPALRAGLIGLLFTWTIGFLTLVPADRGVALEGFVALSQTFWLIQFAGFVLSAIGVLTMLIWFRATPTTLAIFSVLNVWTPTVGAWVFVGDVHSHYTIFLVPLTLVCFTAILVLRRQSVPAPALSPTEF